jgi:hypothetical protein
MQTCPPALLRRTAALLLLVPLLSGGCGPKSKAPPTATPAATEETAPGAIDLAPETLEALVAPIALYPDVVIGHVLLAATNPQEVLDAGNWLLEHADLPPAKLNAEAAKLGMSTSMRALLAFPETVDMMCREIDWTTRLGEAFNADQGAVLDAVQRMRAQAVAVGNLQSSDQLKVKTETSEGKSVVLIEPPKPDVIYVPKYDPVAVYAPPPATIPPPTQTVVVEEKSSNDAIVTGLLCFTAGVVIASALHDDYYGYPPHYGYGGIYYGGHPYYPPPPYMYRPPYGGGYYPAHGYNPGPNYNHSFNNNTIVINQGDKNYWNSDFGGGGRGESGRGSGPGVSNTAKLQSPLTKAKPNRPELQQLNREGQDRTSKANASKPAGGRNVAGTTPATAKPGTAQAKPAVKGSYAGAEKARSQNVASAKTATGGSTAKPAAAARPATASTANRAGSGSKPAAASRPTPSASTGAVDRGYAGKSAATAARPEAKPTSAPAARPEASTASRASYDGGGGGSGGGGAFSGAGNASAERAASQRGRSSMPQGARTTSGSGGGGASRRSR